MGAVVESQLYDFSARSVVAFAQCAQDMTYRVKLDDSTQWSIPESDVTYFKMRAPRRFVEDAMEFLTQLVRRRFDLLTWVR